MAEATETQTPTNTLDAALSRVDQLLASAQPVVEKSFTKEEFDAYMAEQLDLSVEETSKGEVEKSKNRLVALKSVIAAAKASWDAGATSVTFAMKTDPWYLAPNSAATKTETPAPATTTTPSVTETPAPATTTKALSSLLVEMRSTTAKAAGEAPKLELAPTQLLTDLLALAQDGESVAKTALAKSEEGREVIAKAGEALGLLQKIASFFNVKLEPGEDVLSSEVRWQVSDMISALQSAARVESVISSMSATMGDGISKAAETNQIPEATIDPADSAWPMDFAAVTFDEKTSIFKDEKRSKWDEQDA